MSVYPNIQISISQQILTLFLSEQTHFIYSISTAKNGVGELENSGCTPRGKHRIAEKIGENMPINSVFVGRIATGEIYHSTLAEQFPKRDWILTRILWLDGCEIGKNKGYNEQGCCDTKNRFIYIHGTPDTEPMGIPLSHGCIRMKNHDLIQLFDLVTINTPVIITEA